MMLLIKPAIWTSPKAPRERLSVNTSCRLTTLLESSVIRFCASSINASRLTTSVNVSVVFSNPLFSRCSTCPLISFRRFCKSSCRSLLDLAKLAMLSFDISPRRFSMLCCMPPKRSVDTCDISPNLFSRACCTSPKRCSIFDCVLLCDSSSAVLVCWKLSCKPCAVLAWSTVLFSSASKLLFMRTINTINAIIIVTNRLMKMISMVLNCMALIFIIKIYL